MRSFVGELVPAPAYCGAPDNEARGISAARCLADLTTTTSLVLGADHPAVQAQTAINGLMGDEDMFGLYRSAPEPRVAVLADVRAVAGRILAYASAAEIAPTIPADLLTAYEAASSSARGVESGGRGKPGLSAPALAVTTAVGVTSAMAILQSGTPAKAGQKMRWLIDNAREQGLNATSSNTIWGSRVSPTLRAAQLSALSSFMTRADQLRYRTASSFPAPPRALDSETKALARRLPGALWNEWALPLLTPGTYLSSLREYLPALLVNVGTTATLTAAIRLTGASGSNRAAGRLLIELCDDEHWPAVLQMLIAMRDYLQANPPPIDYARRSNLDCAGLLTVEQWTGICRRNGVPGPYRSRQRIAQIFLAERLMSTALPVESPAQRTKVADFPRYLTTDLLADLDAIALDYIRTPGSPTNRSPGGRRAESSIPRCFPGTTSPMSTLPAFTSSSPRGPIHCRFPKLQPR